MALATIICSPKSWVMHFRYGVSPQPAQAPLNSNRGCANWLFLTLYLFLKKLGIESTYGKNIKTVCEPS